MSTRTETMDASALFDDIGPDYEQAFASSTQQKSVNWVIEQLKSGRPRKKVLDIGCGTGRPVCSSLADVGHDVLGIDVSAVMINHARQHVPNAKFEQIGYLDFSVPDDTYDAITVYFSMIVDVTQLQIREMFDKIHRWLRPGGIFVFASVPVGEELVRVKWMGREMAGTSLSSEETFTAIVEAGFKIMHHDQILFEPKAVEAGLCEPEQASSESHIYVHAIKTD